MIRNKVKYNSWQNTVYMVHVAWYTEKSVVLLVALSALLGVAVSVAELLLGPVILGKVEAAAPIRKVLVTIAVFVALLFVLKACTAYINTNVMFGRIAVRVALIRKVQQKLANTSYPNTEDTAVLKKLENARMALDDNRQATEAIWDTVTELLKNVGCFVIYLLLLTTLEPVLILVILFTTISGYLINNYIHKWGYLHRQEEAVYSRHMNYINSKSEDTGLAKDIRILGLASWLEEVFNSTLKLYQAFIFRREKVYIWGGVAEVFLTFLRNGAAYIYLLHSALNHGVSASEFLLYFSAVGGFAAGVTQILEQCARLHRQSLDIAEVRDFLEVPEPFRFEEGVEILPDLSRQYEIRLVNVSFRYPKAEKDTLHDLNLTIHAGEKLAVVGLNGAGKSTLVKLICGFYDPTEGEVLLNGVNIKRYNRRDYYRHFAAVFQKSSILEATVAENISQTNEETDEERMRGCIEKAGLTEKIESLPNGLSTYIGRRVFEDGVELSGGEMQRLMLARALYRNAPILILDEPTAALDPITEHEIYLKYNQMTLGRISLFISHRLASTRFCDRIIFLESGMIVEEGTHENLRKAGGRYEALYEIQGRYYGEGGCGYEGR